jgi:hypothetical protein
VSAGEQLALGRGRRDNRGLQTLPPLDGWRKSRWALKGWGKWYHRCCSGRWAVAWRGGGRGGARGARRWRHDQSSRILFFDVAATAATLDGSSFMRLPWVTPTLCDFLLSFSKSLALKDVSYPQYITFAF